MLNENCEGYSGIESNATLVVIADKLGANLFVSADAGDTWEGPFASGLERAELSLVGDEFWLVSSNGAKATADGKTWRELPKGVPTGKILASPKGSLININRRRCSILRSGDAGKSWLEVFSYKEPKSEYIHGAQGLRDVAYGYITAEPVR